MLITLLFCQKPAGRPKCFFVDSSFINDSDEFGKIFFTRIALEHAFNKKNYKNVTEQLTSNSVLAQIFLMLWTLNPGAMSLCSAVWITCMQFVCVLQNITFCSLFTNCLKPFRDFNYNTVASIIHPSFEMRCFVLVMSFASFFDSFKYFHTADTFAVLVWATIWSCQVFGAIYAVFSLIWPQFRLLEDWNWEPLIYTPRVFSRSCLPRLFIKARCRLLK